MVTVTKIVNRELLKSLSIIILSILVFVLLFSQKMDNASRVTDITENQADQHSNTKESAAEKHRLSSCKRLHGETVKDIESAYASSSSPVDGYQVLLNCSYAENASSPEQKDEYFVIKDLQKGTLYYIVDAKKYILGSLNIIGIKDGTLFYNYCWEGCSSPEFFKLSDASTQKEVQVYPESLDVLYRQSVPRDSQMIVYKNKVLLVSAQRVQELSVQDFSIKNIKKIQDDQIFGVYGEFAGEFAPDFELKDGGILFNIYKKEAQTPETKGSIVGTYFLEI